MSLTNNYQLIDISYLYSITCCVNFILPEESEQCRLCSCKLPDKTLDNLEKIYKQVSNAKKDIRIKYLYIFNSICDSCLSTFLINVNDIKSFLK